MEKPNPKIGHLSFDEWKELAQNDPEKFELERKKATEALISSFPDEKQLLARQTQFRVDRIHAEVQG